ncbi:MAG: YraN family protein [Ruminococcaceae bacterium]|nr:YraN family protein [Oscillospiraceae bacterium]
MNNANTFGQKGEDSAASFLCGKGFTVIGRNIRMNHLETDIIAKNATHIIFAEVKTRSEYPTAISPYKRPACAVDSNKQKRLIAAAEEYLRRNRDTTNDLQPRIDVIEVYIKPESDKYKVLKIVHIENAVHR